MIDVFLGLLASLSLHPAQASPTLHPLPVSVLAVPRSPLIPIKKDPTRFGVVTTAASMFVADVGSGQVLYAKHPHDVVPIASLTKLMTAMVIMDQHPNFDETLTFLPEDFDGEGKAVFSSGDVITQREALQALLIGSVNAAGNALARSLMGKEDFVKAMNVKAASLRLSSPVFIDPTGVDPQNRASAADVGAMLTNALSYPDIQAIVSRPSTSITTRAGKVYNIPSTNLLFDSFLSKQPYTIVGGKTGSLPQAGYCMAQVTRNAEGREIVVVGLGSDNHFSRFQDVKAMTAWVFDHYEWRKP